MPKMKIDDILKNEEFTAIINTLHYLVLHISKTLQIMKFSLYGNRANLECKPKVITIQF